MRPALPLRRRAPLRVAVSGLAASGGADGNGKVWRSTLPKLAARVRLEVVPEGRAPRRRPDVWLADHRPLPAADDAPLVRVIHEASWVREDFRAVLTREELAWADDAICHAAGDATRLLLPTAAGVEEVRTRTGIVAESCDIVAYGHDPERFRPGVHGLEGKRIVHDAGGGRRYVLFCGQAHPKKQLDVLRAAIEPLADLSISLVVVAGPSHRPDAAEALAAAVAALENGPPVVDLTTALGATRHRLDEDELAAVIAGAEVLCLPSLGEGFGLPVLEAMASGVPVLVSDRGALPELVDRRSVLPPDPERMAAVLRRMLTDRDMASHAAQVGLERARPLTWEATAAGWHASLGRAATAGPARALSPSAIPAPPWAREAAGTLARSPR